MLTSNDSRPAAGRRFSWPSLGSWSGPTRLAVEEPTPAEPRQAAIAPAVSASIAAPSQLPEAWRPEAPARAWRYIVFHHTATAGGTVDQIDAAHRRRTDAAGKPWLGIGYHFVIGNGADMADGLVEPTFRWREQLAGAHAGDREHNDFGIGICLVGNFDEQPPTERQLSAARELVDSLVETYNINRSDVLGHGALKATACPGKLFPLAEVAGVAAVEQTAYESFSPLELPARMPASARR